MEKRIYKFRYKFRNDFKTYKKVLQILPYLNIECNYKIGDDILYFKDIPERKKESEIFIFENKYINYDYQSFINAVPVMFFDEKEVKDYEVFEELNAIFNHFGYKICKFEMYSKEHLYFVSKIDCNTNEEVFNSYMDLFESNTFTYQDLIVRNEEFSLEKLMKDLKETLNEDNMPIFIDFLNDMFPDRAFSYDKKSKKVISK